MKRRFLCMALCIALALPMFAGAAYGYTPAPLGAPEGAGTAASPYLIETVAHMQWLADYENTAGRHFRLTQDIGEVNFRIVEFNGIFDGNDRTIHLNINTASPPVAAYTGLFGTIGAAGAVRNLNVTGRVVGLYTTGSVAGINNGTITNSASAADVIGAGQVGGLAGRSTGFIGTSHATGDVRLGAPAEGVFGTGNEIGGLVGRLYRGRVYNSHATGKVTGSSRVGGLVGWQELSAVDFSYATGNVTGSQDYVGGLAGLIQGSYQLDISPAFNRFAPPPFVSLLPISVTRSYAAGDVQGRDFVGGLAGALGVSAGGTNPERRDSTISSVIRGSYAAGNVTGNDRVGGLVGLAGRYDDMPPAPFPVVLRVFTEVLDSYAAGNVSGVSRVGGLVGEVFSEARPPNITLAVSVVQSEILHSYATGAVAGTGHSVAGLGGSHRAVGGSLAQIILDQIIAFNPTVTAPSPQVQWGNALTLNIIRTNNMGFVDARLNGAPPAFGASLTRAMLANVSFWDTAPMTWSGCACCPLSSQAPCLGIWLFRPLDAPLLRDVPNPERQTAAIPWLCLECEARPCECPAVEAVTVNPPYATVAQGAARQFGAAVTGANLEEEHQAVTWAVDGAAGTYINEHGLLTVSIYEAAQSLTVTATSVFNDAISGTAAVTVAPAPPTVTGVTVSPSAISVAPGEGRQFSAAVSGINLEEEHRAVTWAVEGHALAFINPFTGMLVVDGHVPAGTVLTVTATSSFDAAVYDTATVTVVAPPPVVEAVIVYPAEASVVQGVTQLPFCAAVTGANLGAEHQAVTWAVDGHPLAWFQDTNILLITGAVPAGTILTVTATSVADPAVYGTATVTVVAPCCGDYPHCGCSAPGCGDFHVKISEIEHENGRRYVRITVSCGCESTPVAGWLAIWQSGHGIDTPIMAERRLYAGPPGGPEARSAAVEFLFPIALGAARIDALLFNTPVAYYDPVFNGPPEQAYLLGYAARLI